ncbi:MAG: serine--tRNA ligase [Patescibacteria group bacterium]
MLDIKYIRENKEKIILNCRNRNVKIDIDELLKMDEKRKEYLKKNEDLRAERNRKSKGKPSVEDITKLRDLGDNIKMLELEMSKINTTYQDLLAQVPNLTHPDSPIGGEDDFKVISTNKNPTLFKFKPKDHEELMLSLDLVDFERGAKVATSKFYFLKNKMVRFNQALINYGLDIAEKYGYILLETPDLAKNEIIKGAGFNPRGEETQVYSIENSDLSLVGTAEIAVGGYHANEILDLSKGPKKYAALSHCFRTEAGAYGRTSKGLYRVHQFTKLELFVFCVPTESEKYHQELLNIEKRIVEGLKLPYRVIDIASGDLGGSAYRKFDLEAWMTMKGGKDEQGGYGEITSASNCADYQARRLNIKYLKEDGLCEYVHTLNGTGIPLSRFPIAIIENYQQKDGSVKVPKILQKYTGFAKL